MSIRDEKDCLSYIAGPCVDDPCENGACVFDDSFEQLYWCNCSQGYCGDFCEQTDYQCLCGSQPCLNNGTCYVENGNYACECPTNVTGKNCSNSKSPKSQCLFVCWAFHKSTSVGLFFFKVLSCAWFFRLEKIARALTACPVLCPCHLSLSPKIRLYCSEKT